MPGQIRVGHKIANTSVLDNTIRQPDQKQYLSERNRCSPNGLLDDYIVEKKVPRARDSERTTVYVGGKRVDPYKMFLRTYKRFPSKVLLCLYACVYQFLFAVPWNIVQLNGHKIVYFNISLRLIDNYYLQFSTFVCFGVFIVFWRNEKNYYIYITLMISLLFLFLL